MAGSAVERFFEKNPTTGNNIFHELAREGSLNLLQRIRDTVIEPVDFYLREYNDLGETCLHLAARISDQCHAIRVMEILRSLGADMNVRALIGGNTVLHYAIYQNRYELTNWLFELPEINSFIQNDNGDTPLALAIKLQTHRLENGIFEPCRCDEVVSEQDQDEI